MPNPLALENLARSVDLRIEPLNVPTGPGQAQTFQVRPASLLFGPPPGPLAGAGAVIPTEAVLQAAVPAHFSVTWGVEDEGGTPLKSEEAVVYSKPGQLVPGTQIEQALQATVLVMPDFVELRSGIEPPVKTRYVTATVSLQVGEGRGTDVVLPRHPVTIPAVPVPTVALFFAKPNLGLEGGSLQDGDQFILVAVPASSPIAGIDALRDACELVREVGKTASTLVDLAGLAPAVGLPSLTGIASALDYVLKSVNAHAVVGGRVGVAFVGRDAVRDLNAIDVIKSAWYKNDIEAEDTISSLVLIAPPGRRLRIFQHTNFNGAHATVRTEGVPLTIVHSLTAAPPETDPPGRAEQHGSTKLDDRLSSIAFV